MAKKKQPPAEEGGAGVPAWVMTFADLMTLLMTFFVLLLSFSEMDAAKYKQVAGSMEKAFGVQRDFKKNEPPRGVTLIAKEFTPGKPQPTMERVLRQQTTNENQEYLELLTPPSEGEGDGSGQSSSDAQGNGRNQSNNSAAQQQNLQNSREKFLQEQTAKLRMNLSEEIQDGLLGVEILNEGVLLKVREKGSFPSGTANLKRAFEQVIQKIANSLVSPDSRIVVAGHSDDVPIATTIYPSNWMLSAARATSVVQAFIKRTHVDPARLEVRAYADTQPITDNLTAAHRSQNRRVEIFISVPDGTTRTPTVHTNSPDDASHPG